MHVCSMNCIQTSRGTLTYSLFAAGCFAMSFCAHLCCKPQYSLFFFFFYLPPLMFLQKKLTHGPYGHGPFSALVASHNSPLLPHPTQKTDKRGLKAAENCSMHTLLFNGAMHIRVLSMLYPPVMMYTNYISIFDNEDLSELPFYPTPFLYALVINFSFFEEISMLFFFLVSSWTK